MAHVQIVTGEEYRQDGRRQTGLREVKGRMGVSKGADGSAYLEMGDTRVLAAVYGPHEVRAGKGQRSNHDKATINCQYSMAVFSTAERKVRPRGDRKSTEITMSVKDAFEAAILTSLYPRSKIDIFIEVLQSDGSNLAASINAVTLALVDAGISMKGLVLACSIGWSEGNSVTDLTNNEEIQVSSKLTIATIPNTNLVLSLNTSGQQFVDSFDACMQAGQKACNLLRDALVEIIKKQQIDLTE